MPDTPRNALLARITDKALRLYHLNKSSQAAELCAHALELAPSYGPPRLLLARIASDKGDIQAAENHLKGLLDSDPDDFEARRELVGLMLNDQRGAEAVELVRQAPRNLESLRLAALTAEAADLHETAADFHLELFHFEPDTPKHHAAAVDNLLKACRPEKALELCNNAMKAFPHDCDFRIMASMAHQAIGQKGEALKMAAKALEVNPDSAKAWAHMAMLHHEDPAKFKESEHCYRKALTLQPGWVNVLSNLGSLLMKRHDFPGARKIWAQSDSPALQAKRALAMEDIPMDKETIRADRQRPRDLLHSPPLAGTITNPATQIGLTNFVAAYHDLLNRDLHCDIARLHRHLCTNLTTEHASPGLPHKPRRIGVISRYIKMHTVADYFAELLRQVQIQGVPLVFFTFERETNPMLQRLAQNASSIHCLPPDLWLAAQAIARQRLDLLLYLDIGMDPLSYFLAHIRLAPLQCTLYGHPDTTGIPTIDRFISPAIMEPPGAQHHYSETLCMLPGLLSGIPRPPKTRPLSREELGLPIDSRLYLCPQSLIKIHPDFDLTLHHLLDRDPQAMLLLFKSPNSAWGKRLEQRLNLGQRLYWLELTSAERFVAIGRSVDAVLDSPSFSGGATSFKLFGAGVPIVTWSGKFMRSRQTAGIYAHLGIDGPVADTKETFVDLACTLAHDSDTKSQLQALLLDRAPKLFDATAAAAPLRTFLQDPDTYDHAQS